MCENEKTRNKDKEEKERDSTKVTTIEANVPTNVSMEKF